MSTSQMNINGLNISYENGELRIRGEFNKKEGGRKDYDINRDKNFDGDFTGNIKVSRDNVTITINGDMTGNIVGAKIVNVKGDFTGMRI